MEGAVILFAHPFLKASEWFLLRKAARQVLELQEQGFGLKGSMLLNLESDTLAVWYRRLKKYHCEILAGVHDPQHPIPEKVTLTWVT